jgi:hypothetical protein
MKADGTRTTRALRRRVDQSSFEKTDTNSLTLDAGIWRRQEHGNQCRNAVRLAHRTPTTRERR